MTTPPSAIQVEDHLTQLFQHLGIRRAHVGGGYAADALSVARTSLESIVSMTLVCPFRLPADPLRPLGVRLPFIDGDRGPGAGSVPRVLADLPDAKAITLQDNADAAWSDAIAERQVAQTGLASITSMAMVVPVRGSPEWVEV